MKRFLFLLLPLALVLLLIPVLVLIGCGGANETAAVTTPSTTAASTTSAAVAASESTTTTDQTIDDELVGIWNNEQGIELEFTSDGVVFLRYQGQEANSPYSAKDGKISYIDFEPNKEGEFLPTEVKYTVDGDALVWDVGGGGELTLTRRQ